MGRAKTILTFLAALVCFSSPGQDLRDYKTYSTILDEFLRQNGATKDLIIIEKESDTIFYGGDPKSPRLMARLDSLMKKQIEFLNQFQISEFKSVVITRQEFRSLTVDENNDLIWDPLYEKYPAAEGVVFLSPILYTDGNKTAGILQVGLVRNSLSGGHCLVNFDLKKKRKKIKWTTTLVY